MKTNLAPVRKMRATPLLGGWALALAISWLLWQSAAVGEEPAPSPQPPAPTTLPDADEDGEDEGEEDDEEDEDESEDPVPLETNADVLRLVARLEGRAPPAARVTRRIPGMREAEVFPCSECHNRDDQPPNPEIRELEEDHDALEFEHGGGRFWCLTCHDENDRDSLATLDGTKVSFDQAQQVCGQCHYRPEVEFLLGGHGKRLERWQGERVIASCTDCHDPHAPALEPREPCCLPKPRSGLERMPSVPDHHKAPWERAVASPPGPEAGKGGH